MQKNSKFCVACFLGNPCTLESTEKLESLPKIYMWCLLNKTCVKTAIFSKHYANFFWVVSPLLAKYVMLTKHILSLRINCLLYQENSFYPKWKPYFARSLYFFPQSTSNNFRIQNKAILNATISECSSDKNFKSYLSFLKVLWNYFFSCEECHENLW